MEYLRVKMPVLNVKSLRDAETGEELAMHVYSRDDNLLAEPGDELSAEDIQRFRNFRVRAVALLGYQKRWVPGDKESQLPPRAEVIERADFSDAIAEIVDSLQGRESLEYLVDMTRYLRRVARRVGRTEREQQLDGLLEKAQGVKDDYESILEELDDVEDEEAEERIREVLFDSAASTDESFMDLPADDGLLKRVVKAANQRLEVVAPLVDIANDLANEMSVEAASEIDPIPFPAAFESAVEAFNDHRLHDAVDAFPEGGDEADNWRTEAHRVLGKERSKTMELIEDLKETIDNESVLNPILEALRGEGSLNPKILDTMLPDKPQLADRISERLDERIENRNWLWQKLNDLYDGVMAENTQKKTYMTVTNRPPEERDIDVVPPEEAIEEARELIEVGEYLDAVHRLLEGLQKIDAEETKLEGELMVYGEEFEDLLSRRDELEADIEDTVSNEKEGMLKTVLNERQDYKPDHLLNIDTDVMLLENIDTYKTEEMEKLDQFDRYFRKIKERRMD